MNEKTNWRISSLLHENIERFEEHSNRIRKILDCAQDKCEKDRTNFVAVVGSILLLGALPLALWKNQWVLSSISMVMGGVLLAAMVIRHISCTNQIKYATTISRLGKGKISV